LTAFVLALVLFTAALVAIDPPLNGDEPHYEVLAASIAHDHDTDLADDYDDADLIQRIYGGTSLDAHAFAFPGGHGLRSIHGVGLPLLLAPVALVTYSPFWMHMVVVVIAAIGAALLMVLLEMVPFGRTWERWAAWGAVVLSAPIVVYSGQLYPEILGATLTLGAAVLLARARPGPWAMAGAGLLAAALPWVHVRFLAVTLALAAIGVWRCWGAGRRWTLLAAFLAPLIISGVTMAVLFQRWYGSWLPTAQYGLSDSPRSGPGTYRNAVGNLLGVEYGWLPIAPIHALGLVGVGVLVGRLGRSALAGVLGAGLYLLAISVAGLGFGGGTFPGRFLVVIIPLIAVPLLVGLATVQTWWWRSAFFVLGALTLALTGYALATHATSALGQPGTLLGRYDSVWPDLSRAVQQRQVAWSGVPARMEGTVGHVAIDGPPGRGVRGSRTAAAGQAGVLLRGTTPVFPASSYLAAVHLRSDAYVKGTIATLEVRDERGRVDFSRTVEGDALLPRTGWRAFQMTYHTPNTARQTITVTTTGAVGLSAGAPAIANYPGTTQRGMRGYPAVATTIVWIVGIVVVAIGAALFDARQRRRLSRS
jgi:hypothetical protein